MRRLRRRSAYDMRVHSADPQCAAQGNNAQMEKTCSACVTSSRDARQGKRKLQSARVFDGIRLGSGHDGTAAEPDRRAVSDQVERLELRVTRHVRVIEVRGQHAQHLTPNADK